MSQKDRIEVLKNFDVNTQKQFVSYWCYQSLRTSNNHSLEYAINLANKHTLPLIVFTTTDTINTISMRNLEFEIQSIKDLGESLAIREIQCLHLFCSPLKGAVYMAQESAALIVDKPYMRDLKNEYYHMLPWIYCPVIQVESNVVVPMKTVSHKEEYAAYTLRPKMNKLLNQYLIPITKQIIETPSLKFTHAHFEFPQHITIDRKKYSIQSIPNQELSNSKKIQSLCSIDNTINATNSIGGYTQACKILQTFLDEKFLFYNDRRNDPSANNCEGYQSTLSPYLRNGSISPIEISIALQKYIEEFMVLHPKDTNAALQLQESYNSYVEELIVRRELAYNFVYYNPNFDSIKSIPSWAKNTLTEHAIDMRATNYTQQQMEQAETEDPYWNAAQIQLVKTGRMHGYMRMYWGKKILEWSNILEEAYAFTVNQNDKYALDGYDPNGYAGISWCYGTHDRAFVERPVFGKIRYMNANGLRRKFNIDAYANHWLDN